MALVSVTIVGIDAATEPTNVGLALGVWQSADAPEKSPVLRLLEVEQPVGRRPPALRIAEWLAGEGPFLLALDAPLGWPQKLKGSLAGHRAGQPLNGTADELFHRHTDDVVHARLRKRPLEVGANLIARTAHSALRLLEEVRRSFEIPLAWSNHEFSDPAAARAIEVYPAATLLARRWPATGYKGNKPGELQTRTRIAACLAAEVETTERAQEVMRRYADALDAGLCVLAAGDFLAGHAQGPSQEEEQVAIQEGWIWVRQGRG